MRRLAMVLTLTVAACNASETVQQIAPSMAGWKFASGKTPTRAEYAAIVAACQSGAVTRSQGEPLEACLADLGLKRTE
jgi:hypothetical protein